MSLLGSSPCNACVSPLPTSPKWPRSHLMQETRWLRSAKQNRRIQRGWVGDRPPRLLTDRRGGRVPPTQLRGLFPLRGKAPFLRERNRDNGPMKGKGIEVLGFLEQGMGRGKKWGGRDQRGLKLGQPQGGGSGWWGNPRGWGDRVQHRDGDWGDERAEGLGDPRG